MCLILLFACGCLIVLALLVVKTVPLYCFCSFVKGQLIHILMWVSLWALYSVPFRCLFLANITLSCLSLDLSKCQFPDFTLLPQYCVGYPGSFDTSYEL